MSAEEIPIVSATNGPGGQPAHLSVCFGPGSTNEEPRGSKEVAFVDAPSANPAPDEYTGNRVCHTVRFGDIHHHTIQCGLARSQSAVEIRKPEPVKQEEHEPVMCGHLATLGIKPPPRVVTPVPDLVPPEPVYLSENGETFGMRCVCGTADTQYLLILCDKCGFWLHGLCVCVARASCDEPFYCPFCTNRAINCKCGNKNKFSEPLIQCMSCKYWVHKACEGMGWGVKPSPFMCSKCRSSDFTMPYIRPSFRSLNKISFVDCNRYEVIQSLPDGQFRNFVITDMNRTELHLHETVSRYFHTFVQPLFERNHEFWRMFLDTMLVLLKCSQSDILATLDEFANKFLYAPLMAKIWSATVPYGMSEGAQAVINAHKVPAVDAGSAKRLYRTGDQLVHVATEVEEGEFIADLPGFLTLTDEVDADNGISPYCIRLHQTDLVVDMEGTVFEFAPYIKRSFHYNCFAKLYKDGENVRVGLFATRLKGPAVESKRGPAIEANGVLVLPLDGNIPFPIIKCEWKFAKPRLKGAKSTRATRPPMKGATEKEVEVNVQLSLLSAFCEDTVPPMPFDLVNERELITRNHAGSTGRDRTRKSRNRGIDKE